MDKHYAVDTPIKIEIEGSSEVVEMSKGASKFLLSVMQHADGSINLLEARNALEDAARLGQTGFRNVYVDVRLFLRDDIDLPGLLFQLRRRMDGMFTERDDKLFIDEKNARNAYELEHCMTLLRVFSRAIMYGRSIQIVYDKPCA